MQTSAWLILLFPLAGTVVNGLGYRVLPGKTVGWIGTAAGRWPRPTGARSRAGSAWPT